MTKILCVAEKPAIARGVSQHMSGGSMRTHSIQGNQYVKNYEFEFNFPNHWGRVTVNMTSVLGHLTNPDFHPNYRNWQSCSPQDLFDAPIVVGVDKDKQAIADNITRQARYASALFIWTDCDREGEHIGSEIREAALKGKPSLEVARARFSNTERAHVLAAARNPIRLDERQVAAVAARIELDLRIGASLTRWQTMTLRAMRLAQLPDKQVISYGSCQFPTLGFVVDRYFAVRDFIPEPFWYLELFAKKEDMQVKFNWDRNRLFDRMAAVLLFERALEGGDGRARVTKVQTKPTSKWRPLPLTTVELQRLGALFLRIDSQRVMTLAESLYTRGFISYPRTETDQFDKGIDLRALVQKQTQDRQWGEYARQLLEGGEETGGAQGKFREPRRGRNNDKAHPPIHPVNFVERSGLSADEARIYEFVTRRFLACCSDDAHGETTTVNVEMGGSSNGRGNSITAAAAAAAAAEGFHTTGLQVIERNYLDVYVYDKWESSQALPHFAVGETFEPTELSLRDGKTSAPGYLTEPELIQLMDANGIGTDATMAEHIAKIKQREYVITRVRGGGSTSSSSDTNTVTSRGGRGRGRGSRGGGTRGGSSAAASSSSSRSGVTEFIPSTLGTALIKGYDSIAALEGTGLGKPFLRREMEAQMRDICAGAQSSDRFVADTLSRYRAVFAAVERDVGVLKASVVRYVVNGGAEGGLS